MCDVIECIFVEVVKRDESNCKMIIGCIYRPANSDVTLFNEQLSSILKHTYLIKSKEIVIMGDFNFNILHHGSHNPESTFLNVMLSYGFLPAITKPSRVTDLSATLLDNIFTNFDVVKCKSALLYEDISDHYPVMLSYSTKPPNKNCPSNQSNCKKRVFNQKSIEKFQLYCANDANWYQIYQLRNSNSKDPNLIYEEFLDIFKQWFS